MDKRVNASIEYRVSWNPPSRSLMSGGRCRRRCCRRPDPVSSSATAFATRQIRLHSPQPAPPKPGLVRVEKCLWIHKLAPDIGSTPLPLYLYLSFSVLLLPLHPRFSCSAPLDLITENILPSHNPSTWNLSKRSRRSLEW